MPNRAREAIVRARRPERNRNSPNLRQKVTLGDFCGIIGPVVNFYAPVAPLAEIVHAPIVSSRRCEYGATPARK